MLAKAATLTHDWEVIEAGPGTGAGVDKATA
jgi:hypothetical protein